MLKKVNLFLIKSVLTSISILDENWAIWKDCWLIAEVEINSFANSLIDATIQDNSKIERSDD